ncbi:hypothetical protein YASMINEVIRUS_185 [Yasminevirus sp. GU-2018]|uniref:CCHC-type domain-containing protein n=1 Tax=Yasminevirus sp. GU-2018 TaxID=2420051 RepID=A0A5K0U8I9_9VIRU|nr:hypothetical protein YASMINEVIRUS_185 [Yasminevirus sp. GU-2018]
MENLNLNTEPKNRIYVLELEHNKYYVGRTKSLLTRLADHMAGTGKGSLWTQKYKPVELLDIFPDREFEEDRVTLKLMKEKGVDNVRGGSFCNFELSQEELHIINKMMNSAGSTCFKCNNLGHYANECTVPNNVNQHVSQNQHAYPNKFIQTTQKGDDAVGVSNNTVKQTSFPRSFRKKMVSTIPKQVTESGTGDLIQSSPRCDSAKVEDKKIGVKNDLFKSVAFNLSTQNKTVNVMKARKTTSNSSSLKREKCTRCGRYGHNVDKCYASVHITGAQLDPK